MPVLRSYVSGRWTAPPDGRPVRDAVTGEEIARISSEGIDLAAALDYGRRVGGPALRALTFHERAALAKAVGGMLREHRDELYALSARTGATLGDSKFDVDGGIGVLLSYASKARRELPNDTVYIEGAVEPLGRGGQFARPAHPHSPPRSGRPGQRVQLPGLGTAGENGPGADRRRAHAGQAGLADRVPDRAAGRADRRVRDPARGQPAAALRQRRRPAGPSRRAGPAQLHRLRLDRAPAAGASERRGPRGAFQRRGRLAQLLDPRPGRHARDARVRPVRPAARDRDDGEGRAEVHGDPPGLRARPAAGRGHRCGGGPAGKGRHRQPGR